MSNKNIKLKITADTQDAKKEIEELNKKLGNGKFKFKGKSDKKSGKSEEQISNSDYLESLSDDFKGLNKNLQSLDRNLKNFLKNFEKQGDKGSNNTTGSTKPEVKSPERKPNVKPEVEKGSSLDKISKLIGAAITGSGVKSYLSNGMNVAQNNNVRSMDTFARLGIYGNKFEKGTKEAYKVGSSLGFNASETISLQDQLLRNTGFTDKNKLDSDTTAFQRFSKAYGVDTSESIPMYSEFVKRGGFGPGQAEEMSKVISTSISKQGMEGRESEQVKAINQIFDVITSGKINVTSQDLKASAGLLDALGKQNSALKGEKGAELLSKSQGLFDTNDYTKLRLFGYGLDGNVGLKGLLATERRMAKGWSDPENLKYLRKTVPMYSGGSLDSDVANIFLQHQAGFNVLETDEFLNLLKNNNSEEIYKKYNNTNTLEQDKILENVQDSRTNKREQYEVAKEQASNTAGNASLNALGKPNDLFTALPSGIGAATSLGGTFLKGIFAQRLLKTTFQGLSGLGKGAKVTENIAPNFFKDTNILKGMPGLEKVGSKVGKVGVALPAIIGGVQATKSFMKGDKEKGSEELGRGLGTTGGIIAGAKLGGTAGSLVAPGLGTAAGVLGGAVVGGIGGFLGGKIGKGTYKLFSKKNSNVLDDVPINSEDPTLYSDNKKENELLAWKERLLKKEEEIFDNFLNQNKESKKESKENPNESKNEEPSVDKFYGDSILKKDSSSNKNNVVGNVLESLTGKPAPSISGSDSSSVLDIKQIPGIDKLPKETQAELNKIIGKLSSKKQKFVKEVLPGAIESYNKYGVFPSVTLGQGALESNWGNSGLTRKYNNAFGIKASKGWTGKVANMGTAEYGKNGRYNIKANFRAYDDINQSVLDHGEFLQKNSRYKNNGVFSAKNSQEQIKAIAKAGYATDPNYANSTYKLMESNGFVDIDKILAKSSIKSYAIGTDKVDKDQLAFIHKDEAVLNKFDADEYRQQGSSQGGTINLNFNINGAGTSQENLTETIQNAIKQAIQRLGFNNGGQVNLSKSYYRYQN